MAFSNVKLSDVVVVSAGSTTDIITVASSKKVYIRSIMVHAGTAVTTTAQVYVVPNGGSVADSTRMFNVDVVTNETVLIEPSFPIVLDTNGDKLSVGAGASTVNVFITGDKEA
tara:strand:- start:1564 stop:1902 length:339 start_codon:yes stop_codon:yes gene_type:complete